MATTNGVEEKLNMHYQNLGSSGLKVSKVVIGSMSYGTPTWQGRYWMRSTLMNRSLPILKHAYDRGINTWDTADVYSNGESEKIVAKAIETYSITRSKLVILSEYFSGVREGSTQTLTGPLRTNYGEMVNQIGLSRKHIFDAVEASVRRLGTYIDVLQTHRLDRETPAKEIMKALNDVIERGWVRYIGASSIAAWEFQNLQWIARTNGWHEFISMQSFHCLIYREEEREMILCCKHTGVGLIPWSPVARGVLCRPWGERTTKREGTDNFLKSLIGSKETEVDKAIVDRVEKVAKKHGVSMTCVATGWSISKGCCPIIGLSSKERVDEAVFNSTWQLTEEDAKYLEDPYMPKAIQGY